MVATDFMSIGAIHNRPTVSHLYLHIPFCAQICPYCAFYKERTDQAYAQRFCEAMLRELDGWLTQVHVQPRTIFFGGGTPTTLTISQLNYLGVGLRERLDLSALE